MCVESYWFQARLRCWFNTLINLVICLIRHPECPKKCWGHQLPWGCDTAAQAWPGFNHKQLWLSQPTWKRALKQNSCANNSSSLSYFELLWFSKGISHMNVFFPFLHSPTRFLPLLFLHSLLYAFAPARPGAPRPGSQRATMVILTDPFFCLQRVEMCFFKWFVMGFWKYQVYFWGNLWNSIHLISTGQWVSCHQASWFFELAPCGLLSRWQQGSQ